MTEKANSHLDGMAADCEARELRNAFGAFGTGVAIVTTIKRDGTPLGATISSFNTVSLSPPLVLFSLAKNAMGFSSWCEAQDYTVSVLSERQQALSNHFGRSSADKWSEVDLDRIGEGLTFHGVLAAFECAAHNRFEGGDHEIFVGRVLTLRCPTLPKPPPLVFYEGAYRKLDMGVVGIPCHDAMFW
jgi:flavin reductase (DIM6/NTAB) family NADH-FMN oxidoreductase RutF